MWDVVVIGGGIAGLTAAYELHKRESGLRLCLVERDARLGGKIVSDRVDGFLVEGGPDSFITHKPWALELVRELGLEHRIVAADQERATTYVVKNGRLVPLPLGPRMLTARGRIDFLRSPLLSPGAKLRIGVERWVRPRRDDGDESVADFVRRRFGGEVLESLAQPLLAHIHVADVERMSLAATYPRLAEMERRHGSLTAGLRQLRRHAGGRSAGSVFLTLRGGMGELAGRLADALPPEARRPGRTVSRLEAARDGEWTVHLDDGTRLATRAAILALPAFAAADVVEPASAELARRLRAIRYVSLATLTLGYRRRELGHPLDGFGFFVPRREGRALLACTWTSEKFAGRTPDAEHALVRCFVGGALGEEVVERDDASLVGLLRRELDDILGLRAAPVLERLYRWPRGYPQYEVGHLERVRRIEEALPPGLAVAGSAYHGVGLPDCIRSARRAAEGVLAGLAARVAEVDGGALAC